MSKVPLRKAPPFTAGIATLFENLSGKELAEQMCQAANRGDPTAVHWLARLVGVTPSTELFQELVSEAPTVPLLNSPVVVRGPGIAWRYGYTEPAGTPAQRARYPYALAMVRIVIEGLLPRIKRCKEQDCGKYFFGDPRARWCSTTCGSRARVRAKRRKDGQ
jgi:predicted RNA-binding Zn ribbon-like protein